MRQIIIDTETTGLEPEKGHRIIEIGCVELINRQFTTNNNFHVYINPQRQIDAGATAVHGITTEFLAAKPTFAEIVADFLAYIEGAELIAHNAPFDVGFINHELKLSGKKTSIADYATVVDTLKLARKKHPGQRNSLDALCKRYKVDSTKRNLHGALLDARLLAEVYLRMTGGQTTLLDLLESLESSESSTTSASTSSTSSASLVSDEAANNQEPENIKEENNNKNGEDGDAPRTNRRRKSNLSSKKNSNQQRNLKIIAANETELTQHHLYLERLKKATGGKCLWEETE